ncbi:hypothetical protein AW14_01640 [Siansivirga zeaxanthinifaciens CC-SAMT-1]|uniref:Uncharacterized protein n=2 Tax=Siansivirga TaxID=1204360 RepID=A0A0C5WAY1_9FLAO|nr:hypothetical protein AW14_01640 [Siansivirga zeaxanthinifaciens CC-SAMT-1]
MILSCSNSDEAIAPTSLKSYLNSNRFEKGAVIACSASDMETANVLTFFYPVLNAVNARLYETTSVNVNPLDFENYTQVFLESEPIFNGYLRRFSQESSVEKWLIVTFELENEIKVSNPIRSKQFSKPTRWQDIVSINQSQVGMPLFSWPDNPFGDNAIYFQIVSDGNDNLLSGTYTNQNQFQYYKLDNVVLNITRETPPILQLNTSYNFTLMDVSLDNWVNAVTLNKSFVKQ